MSETGFRALPDGRPVRIFTLASATGICVEVMEFGATIVRLFAPDRSARTADVVLGFDSLAPYLERGAYLGAVVGRYANRIANAEFRLDGTVHRLSANEGANHLHGGATGFDRHLWRGRALSIAGGEGVAFTRTSPAGEEGYPGTLEIEVRYVLAGERLRVGYQATCDAPTVVNLSQHSYFNLAGHDGGAITEHELTLDAAFYTPIGAGLIPTGEVLDVAGTPFDFRVAKPIGRDIGGTDSQLALGGGYDHNFVLSAVRQRDGLHEAARLYDPASGRELRVFTDQPGVQFYSGNQLDGIAGKSGTRYGRRHGLCLETQHFPNSPNTRHFPSTVLRPGAAFDSSTVFEFSVRA